MNDVRVMVLTGYGLNCDHETAHAFRLAGASPNRVHLHSLIRKEIDLSYFQILVFVGGFSWGDDHGAGVIQAVRLKTRLGNELVRFVESGNLVIGICNGFQTLVNLGLLPGLEGDYTARSVALTYNDCGKFRDDWVRLRANENSPCVFTRDIRFMELPVRHGEGKFITDPHTLSRLVSANQVVFQYALEDGKPADGKFPCNPNGSMRDIAGICDPTGRVFGLMPHPEAFNHWTNHPDWTRIREGHRRREISRDQSLPTGLKIFQNAVEFVRRSANM
jgi:phosphoribosylformylglycinamidine synthase